MPVVAVKPGKLFRVAIPLFALALMGIGAIVKIETQPPATYVNVDLRALGWFPFDQTSGTLADVPPKWRALDGQKVHLQGMLFSPLAGSSAISDFQLVYQLRDDSGRGPPRVQERVFGKSRRPFDISDDFVDVYGTLHVNVKRDADNGPVTQVFALDADRISIVDPAIDPTRNNRIEPRRIAIGRDLIPIGAFLLALAALRELLLYMRRDAGRQKARRDLCPKCGYDLRASPQRCPECGTITQR
ncbi:MAG TPA: hypothetical protein VFE47_32260 [Tepidisphaeraceae bacterium]|jgi:hypothetical protein|nr:hypothetical protein [Tepidisphaeraceae bacterium]